MEIEVVKRGGTGTGTDIYIGRPGRFGNPFVIGRDGDRATVIAKFETWLDQHDEVLMELRETVEQLSTRGTVRLVCFCAPLPCHGDVYKRLLLKGA